MTTLEAQVEQAVPSDVAQRAPRPPFPFNKLAGGVVVLAMLGLGVYGLASLDFSTRNFQRSYNNTVRVFQRMDPISIPKWDDLFYLIGLTVGIVVLGTLVAAIISVPVAWLAAKNTTPTPALRWVGRAIGVLTRAVPDVVLALAFSLCFVLGSPMPGIFAFGIHSVGMISKLFADAIEQIDEGPRLAIRAAGGSRSQEFWSGVFPQVLPSWIATVLHRSDINMRGSAILGYAGVGGLGYAMRLAFEDFPAGYGRGIGIALVIFVLCVLLEVISSTIRRNLLGIRPSGNGLGNRVYAGASRLRASIAARNERGAQRGRQEAVRAATRNRPAPAPKLGAGAATVTVESMLRRPWTRARVGNLVWIFIALVVVVGSYFTAHVQFTDITWPYVLPTLQSFWPPNLGSHTFADFGEALLITIEVAFAAAVLSLVFSLIFGSLAARNVAPNGFVRNIFRVVLTIFRGIPELVLAILLIMITGFGDQAGVVALGIGGIGLLGKLIADSFEEVPNGPERALTAVGASRGQRYLSATWTQGLPALVSNSLYLVDTNIRAATILGIVGGGGIGFYLTNASTVLTLHGQVTTLVSMVVVTVLVVEGITQWLRRVYS